MNRRLAFLIAAFETLVVAAISLGALLLPLTIVWLFENDPTIDWFVAYRASADVWMMAQGTRLVVAPSTLLGADVPLFVISLIPLGLSIFIAWMALRLGRKLTTAIELWPAWLAAGLVYGGVSLLLSTSSFTKEIYPVTWQGTFFPPVFFMFFVIAGSLLGKRQAFGDAARIPEPLERVKFREWYQNRFDKLHWSIRALLIPALRAGTAVVVVLILVSSVFISILMAINWVQVIRLYEGLQVSFLGGLMVTTGQLVVLPNLIVYGAAWFIGVGFQIGAGSLISPLGTIVGPLPALPIVGALPVGHSDFGLVAVVVPLVGAFLATLMIRNHADAIRFEFASAWSAAISLGLAVALVASVEIGLLAVLASGGIGPDRLQVVGVNPFIAAGVLFVEVASVAILAAFFSARPDKPDHPLVVNRRG